MGKIEVENDDYCQNHNAQECNLWAAAKCNGGLEECVAFSVHIHYETGIGHGVSHTYFYDLNGREFDICTENGLSSNQESSMFIQVVDEETDGNAQTISGKVLLLLFT